MNALAPFGDLPGRKPASDRDLRALQSAIGDVPKDLRALYAWSGNLDRLSSSEAPLTWLSPTGAIANWRQNRKVVSEFPANLLPIATDGAGNFACYDVKSGRIVDWDHETREVSALARSLEQFVEKELLAPIRRDVKDAAATAAAKPVIAGAAPTALPRKLVAEKTPMLSKVDRESYGGGSTSLVFVADDRLLVTFYQLASLVKLGAAKEPEHVRRGGIAAAEPGGKRIVTSEHGELALLDPSTGRSLNRWASPHAHVIDLQVSSNGLIANSDAIGTLLLWNMASLPKGPADDGPVSYELPKGKPHATLKGHDGWVFCRFSANGALLASGDTKGHVQLWNTASRRSVASADLAGEEVRGLAFSRDGHRVFIGVRSGRIEVRDTQLKKISEWKTKDSVLDLRMLQTGALASLGDKLLQLWNPSTSELLCRAAGKKARGRARISDERGSLVATAAPAALYRLA